MRVLHYIPVIEAGDLLSDCVKALATAMKDMAEVDIAVSKDNVAEILAGADYDIVHIHACWDWRAAKAARLACRKGIALVVSPHCGLEPYAVRHEQRIGKLLKRTFFQRRMLVSADALIAVSLCEQENLMSLGWNKRIRMVPSPVLNSGIQASQAAKDVVQFYNKVLDTRYFLRMSGLEKEAFRTLLYVSKERDVHSIRLSEEKHLTLRTLKREQWRRLLMYADDEGVRDLIDEAIRQVEVDVPGIDTAAIDRYATPAPKDTGALERDALLYDKESVREKLADELDDGDGVLRTICVMFLNARWHLRNRTLSMRHIADLYDAVRYEDYDEDRLVEVLKRLGMRKTASRFLQILREDVYLTDGFTPFEPVDDRGTQRIREQILH